MGRVRQGSIFARPAGPVETCLKDPAALAAKAKKQNEEIEGTPPHHAIRHPDMRNFWERCLKCNEVPWDTFWLHFPTGLAPEVFVDSTFSSHKERRAFQKAVHVVGSPEHVTVAMIDVAFPPGCPIGESATRLLREVGVRNSISRAPEPVGKHIPIGLQCAGFWDEAPASLPALRSLSTEVEAEMSFADGERTAVAQVLGPVGSGALSVAADSARRLLSSKFWSSAICVGMQGACSAEIAAARVATALGILSFPVFMDELLRLTAFFHTRSEQEGRLGIVLDAEGCSRADELHGLAVLVTTLVKAGGRNLQIIVAGEGSLELSRSASCSSFHVVLSDRAAEVAFLSSSIRADYLQNSAPAVAAICGHQATLLDLAAANLQTGKVLPQALINAVSSSVTPTRVETARGKASEQLAGPLIKVIMAGLTEAEGEALFKLSVLPASFPVSAATKALGQDNEKDTDRLLQGLLEKGFLRSNVAFQSYGMPPLVRAEIKKEARSSTPNVLEAGIAAFIEYNLELVEKVASLNAANAQVAAMWVIDRERPMLDELVNLLHDRQSLPAVTAAVYAEIVSEHMDSLGFRLSIKQQQELCLACAQASRQLGDILGEANCLQHLGQLGNVEAADAAMGRAMGTVERALTPDHPVIADMLLSRARLQTQAGNHHQAEKLLRRSLDIQQHYMKDKSMAIVGTQTRLAGALIAMSAPERALPYLQAAVDATLRELGATHPDTALAQCRLASCQADLLKYTKAHNLYLAAVDGWRESLGHCHPQFAVLLGQLAFTCCHLHQADEAEQYYRRSIQMWKEMMVLDQPELQADLKGLADLLQRQGRGDKAAEIREQLVRLVDAVKAAHTRMTKKATSGRGWGSLLLLPLKACMPVQRRPALVALPQGIQDSDLEELRLAAKAQAVVATAVVASKQSVAEEGLPMMEGTQLASHGSAAMAALTHGTDQAPCPDAVILEGQGTMVVHHDVPATDAITGMLNVDRQAPDPALPNDEMKPLENGRATRHRPASQSEDGSGGTSKDGRSARQTPRNQDRARYYQQSAVPFGSKGRGPSAGAVDKTTGVIDDRIAPTGEASVWAASLRNPAIPLANPTAKRVSPPSLSARSDSSGTKNRLFTVSDSRRQSGKGGPALKAIGAELAACESPQAQGELIRAHTQPEQEYVPQLLSQGSDMDSYHSPHERQDSFTSASGYASDDTIVESSRVRMRSIDMGAAKHLISQVNGADPSSTVGKNVIGFYNPIFTEYGQIGNAPEPTFADEKVEV